MTTNSGQPDWDRIAEGFDLLAPQLAPVGDALIAALGAVTGDQVLDIASGTGEPALTLARRRPDVRVTGVDAADGMVRAASNKVEAARLDNIRFQVMAAEQLDFPAATFDRALCRFGIMLFDDPLQGCRQIHRVMKPGGRFAFAVWQTPESMTTMHWAVQVFRGRVPGEQLPPIGRATSLGGPGVFERLLAEAGYIDVSVAPLRFDYRYASFEDWWEVTLASGILDQQLEALPADADLAAIREAFSRLANEYLTTGGLVIPHQCLIATGGRPAA